MKWTDHDRHGYTRQNDERSVFDVVCDVFIALGAMLAAMILLQAGLRLLGVM